MKAELKDISETEIAIIGMAARVPGAKTLEDFWQNLRNGVESVTTFTDEELLAAGQDRESIQQPTYVKKRPVIHDVDMFDAAFFGFNPREAEGLDPQHRLFLEMVWQAIEDAGHSVEDYPGNIGVYGGTSISNYLINHIFTNAEARKEVTRSQGWVLGNIQDSLATRVAYKLNLKGPCYSIQTFCSTSLVSTHLACCGLQRGECDLAVAGGVTIYVPQVSGYLFEEGGIRSPDGHCRAFDSKAGGTVFGNGVGVVVLKRLRDALADGDRIEAIIKGSAANNDGSAKVSYMAPGVNGQAEVISKALQAARVHPESVHYIETHGTGTSLGDSVEIAALTKAFRAHTAKSGYCAIGSLKPNIGHLDAASGVASLIKAVLCLKNEEIPPSINCSDPNAEIDFANTPFQVNLHLKEWKSNGTTPRRVGINSFGIGGTNVHMILEEAPASGTADVSRPSSLLVLSAKTPSALDAATAQLKGYLSQDSAAALPDVAFTLQAGRVPFPYRRAVVCRNKQEAIARLGEASGGRAFSDGPVQQTNPPLVFLFPGQGTQRVNMGLELYSAEPEFRRQMDICFSEFNALLGIDLKSVLYPPPGGETAAAERLKDTLFAQPALFTFSHSLARLLISWGIKPAAMIGHSLGEYVAATLAGPLSLKDAIALLAKRAQLMQSLERGAMVAVFLDESAVKAYLGEDLSLAAINGERLCTVSGPIHRIEALEARLASEGVACARLQTSHAFHSAMLDPIQGALTECARTLSVGSIDVPYISNLTGAWMTLSQARDPGYWFQHSRHPVRFLAGVAELRRDPTRIFLEVGFGQTLTGLVRKASPSTTSVKIFSSFSGSRDAGQCLDELLTTVGGLWAAGVSINWKNFNGHGKRLRVRLPTYPFERSRYWIENRTLNARRVLRRNPEMSSWFYVPSWQRSNQIGPSAPTAKVRLVFADESGHAERLIESWRNAKTEAIVVRAGQEFQQPNAHSFILDPSVREHYFAMAERLKGAGVVIDSIVHAWNLTERKFCKLETAETGLGLGFYSLLFVAQAFGEANPDRAVGFDVLSEGGQDVIGNEAVDATKAMLAGVCRVISQEYRNLACRNIDVVWPSALEAREAVFKSMERELSLEAQDCLVALREGYRWVQRVEQARVRPPARASEVLKRGGVYLITGGLGGVGLSLAQFLARSCQPKLILTSRKQLPPEEAWDRWVETHGNNDAVSSIIGKIRRLKALGAETFVAAADVADYAAMKEALAAAEEKFGSIDGVIHAAGIAGGGIIPLKTVEGAAKVLSPKVRGTLVLDELLGDRGLDFFILCSSVAALAGGIGQVDYCAANCFLDAYAWQRRSAQTVISLNWCAWQEVGMAVNTQVPSDMLESRNQSINLGISPAEAMNVFECVLRERSPQFIISPVEFSPQSPKKQSAEGKPVRAAVAKAGSRHPRPSLASTFVMPGNPTEETIAEIWRAALGLEEIGINDNFFELGGHSLLATQMIAQLKSAFAVSYTVADLFARPTIRLLSEMAVEKAAAPEFDRSVERGQRRFERRLQRSRFQEDSAN